MEIKKYLETSNIVVVYYPRHTGGKFLINCLGLSNQAVLQDNSLAKLQIDGLFTPENKISLLLDRLKEITNHWDDLKLGCTSLFGGENHAKITNHNFKPDNFIKNLDPVIKLIIEKNYFFFIVAHDDYTLKNILYAWPNAKIIYLTDYYLYRDTCRVNASDRYYKLSALKKEWNLIKKYNWPELPPASIQTLKFFPEHVLDELYNGKNNYILNLIFDENSRDNTKKLNEENIISLSNNRWIERFAPDCYLNEDLTISNIEFLYKKLNFSDFNKEYITQYYRLWMQKISQTYDNNLTNVNK
jgi:hypothetical protein